jgi:hypothetical protein
MSDTIINQAAWQLAPEQNLQLGTTDLPTPAANEILIRNAAIAINPLDWILQDMAILPWLTYPAILGSDVAGEIVAIGSRVDRFKIGDRVIGQAVGTTVNEKSQGAFQNFTIVLEHMAAPIPNGMAFSEAVVLPLGLGTAASGLYGRGQLALQPPSHSPISKDEVVLVWGGSSSVGNNAIQLAAASGYTVFTVAAEINAKMLTALGASKVFDYANPSVVEEVIKALKGKRFAGALHATGDVAACFAVVSQCEGKRIVAATLAPSADLPPGVEARHIAGTSLKDDEVGPMIYKDFLPQALVSGSFVASPPARIVGHGLAALQDALQVLKAGVSAVKVVVTLD